MIAPPRTPTATTSRVLAIDPGSAKSGVVLYDPIASSPVVFSKVIPNEQVLRCLKMYGLPGDDDGVPIVLTGPHVLAVEMIASYGMAVGAEVFDTCVWIGRFIEAWGGEYRQVLRREVKLNLCASVKAKDVNVWQAIVDRFGGKDAAVGRKASPGPLYGVSSHARAALAVALTYQDTKALSARAGADKGEAT